ncbi:28 kDa ribonucleoprotein, chloroplastic [Nicotiana tabacum]|uniref:28 kDa ribonucleoprotein, chloroplastic n=2 Tax=Nicotiana TaxID=4085 RepID=A0A1S3Z3J7_TOBAC|nr:PREDICTED: 28 kDa ribonucleoprotein, chloroplastic [Nicotiana sylvestris]XP_016458999.1 PREDICTED: 28 kDa ribonucleoprotein, chloroplastic [Nicotiana tabacum]
MAAIEVVASSIFSSPPSSSSSSYLKFPLFPNSVRLENSTHYPNVSLKSLLWPLPLPSRNQWSHQLHCSTVEEVAVQEKEEKTEKIQRSNQRRKLFVLNLPWSLTVPDIKTLFAESGIVEDVEIIKTKDGKNRGFAFVTMSSGEEAQAAIDKLDSYELLGRIIRVEFAKRFKKPAGAPPPSTPPRGETRHKLYVSNLAWKVRSTHLRDFFSTNHNPVSVRVVFDNASGRAAGYGFVSFDTKEEAEAALSAYDGKELMGRPIRLKFSEKDADGFENKEEPSTHESPEEP